MLRSTTRFMTLLVISSTSYTYITNKSLVRVSLCDSNSKTTVEEIQKTLTQQKKQKKKSKASLTNTQLLLSMVTAYDWVLFGISALCSIFASLMTTTQAKMIGKLFDSMGKSENLNEPLRKLFSVFIMQSIFTFASSTSLSLATTNLGVNLRVAFFSSIMKQDMSTLDERKTGELTHQLTQDIAALQTTVRESFTRGVEGITSLISGSYLLYSISKPMAFGLLGLLPLGAFAGTFLGENLRTLSQKSREASNRATGIAAESITNVRTVRAFAAEEREVERYKLELDSGANLKTQMAISTGGFYSAIALGVNLTTLLIVGWGHRLIEQGALTKGDIATIATQVQLLERSLARLSVLSASLSKSMRSSEHIFRTIKTDPKVNKSVDHPIEMTSLKGNIDFVDVNFGYPTRENAQVLFDLNIRAHQGEVVALVGSSGSGKTTIFSLVERFYDPTSGAILFDGVNLKHIDPYWLRQTIGYVPQKAELFSGTIGENIRYGKLNATEEEVIEAAKRANAHDFISALPNGYNTKIGEQGIGLSGGQQQRISIARTMLLNPKVLLLDEITSGLDSESEYLVGKALDELMKGRTTLVIAHRLNTVKNAARIYVLEDGNVVESGTHDDLVVKNNGAYRAFWERQNRGLKRANTHKTTA